MTHKSFQKNLLGTSALILAGALAASSAFAQPAPGQGPGPGRFARGIRAAMATLDLTADQQTKIKAIFESHRDEGQAFRAQMEADRSALKAAASAATPDPTAVGQAFLKVQANRKTAAAKMKAVRTEIDTVLTPEQRAKLDGWIAAHRQQRRAMMGGPRN